MTPFRAAAVAFLAGLAVMVLELCAVRLEAPYFGDSAYVWTNVIGVILAALAVGALLGGRLADRSAPARQLAFVLFAAALLVSLVPFLAKGLGSWLVPQDLPLEAAMPALVRGSLVATLLLFAPPVLLLGAVSPWLVRLVGTEAGRVGRAAGLVSAMATLGSLVGTFLATHVLVPHFGSRTAVLASAALLALAGALCLGRAPAAALVVAPLLGVLALPVPLRDAGPGETLLAEAESRYQFLQVVRTDDRGVPVTALKINEGLDSFHSLARGDGPFTAGAYYDYHVVTPWLARAGTQRSGPMRVLSLGSACGTFDRLFAAVHQGCRVDEVEIDGCVSRLGDRHFGGKASAGSRHDDLDARVFVNRARTRYDVVLVDAYARQIYVPAHVVSGEFFGAVADLLEDGGIVSVNLGGVSFDDPVLCKVASTLATRFRSAHALRVPNSRNFVLVARKGRDLDVAALASVAVDTEGARSVIATWRNSEVRSYGAAPAAPAAPPLADGWPLLDVLQDEALRARTREATLLGAEGGTLDPARVQGAVTGLMQARSYERAVEELARTSRWTAYLRFLAGDLRWHLHDPEGARLEYEEARRLDAAVVPKEQLEDRIAGATALTETLRRARAVGARNGWLAAAAFLGLALGAAFLLARQKMSSTPAT